MLLNKELTTSGSLINAFHSVGLMYLPTLSIGETEGIPSVTICSRNIWWVLNAKWMYNKETSRTWGAKWGNFITLGQRTYLFFELHPHVIPPKGSILTRCKRRAAHMSMMKSLFLRAHWWLDQSKPLQTLITLNECKNSFHWIPSSAYAAIDSFRCKNNTTWNTLNLISLVRNE